jgi:hypothetical protein
VQVTLAVSFPCPTARSRLERMILWKKSGQQRYVVVFTQQDSDNLRGNIKHVLKTVVKRLSKRIKAL